MHASKSVSVEVFFVAVGPNNELVVASSTF